MVLRILLLLKIFVFKYDEIKKKILIKIFNFIARFYSYFNYTKIPAKENFLHDIL